MMCVCVVCGSARPFSGDDKCRECESHKMDALIREYENAVARLEAHTKIVALDFRGYANPNENRTVR